MKTLTVTHGPRHNLQTVTVELPGELDDARLTPMMARRAARIACGHEYNVKVMDNLLGYGYQIFSPQGVARNSYKKIYNT